MGSEVGAMGSTALWEGFWALTQHVGMGKRASVCVCVNGLLETRCIFAQIVGNYFRGRTLGDMSQEI